MLAIACQFSTVRIQLQYGNEGLIPGNSLSALLSINGAPPTFGGLTSPRLGALAMAFRGAILALKGASTARPLAPSSRGSIV